MRHLNIGMGAVLLCFLGAVAYGRQRCSARCCWLNTYEHAVNFAGYGVRPQAEGRRERGLKSFLAGPTPVAEGDIALTASGQAVMAHGSDEADQPGRIAFKEWVWHILSSEQSLDPNKALGYTRKGFKLDLKEDPRRNEQLGLGSAALSQIVLSELRSLLSDPAAGISEENLAERFLMVNADIAQGPGGHEPATTVLDLMAWRLAFPQLRLSLGFTQDRDDAPYSRAMLHTQLAHAISLGGPIDFNLRAPRVRASLPILREVVRLALDHPRIPSLTLTIWDGGGDLPPTDDELALYLHGILPEHTPTGKTAAVLLDLQGHWVE